MVRLRMATHGAHSTQMPSTARAALRIQNLNFARRSLHLPLCRYPNPCRSRESDSPPAARRNAPRKLGLATRADGAIDIQNADADLAAGRCRRCNAPICPASSRIVCGRRRMRTDSHGVIHRHPARSNPPTAISIRIHRGIARVDLMLMGWADCWGGVVDWITAMNLSVRIRRRPQNMRDCWSRWCIACSASSCCKIRVGIWISIAPSARLASRSFAGAFRLPWGRV